MDKVLIRLTEGELKQIIDESVTSIIREHDNAFMLQVVAQAIAQKGNISVVGGGENDVEVELGGDKIAYVLFNVEVNPYIHSGMKSNDYDVPDDPDEIVDEPKVEVIQAEILVDDNSIPLEDNGIIAKALENAIEVDYSSMDVPSEEDYYYYEE